MTKNVNTIDTITLSDETVDLGPLYSVDLSSSGSLYAPGNIAISGATGTSYNWGVGANGTSAVDWNNLTIGASINSSINTRGLMELHGEDADIKVNGRSLMDAIAALEQRLNILVPNPELEAEWDELRELGERYRELEKKCKEKGEMWKKLKQMPPPQVD